MDTVRWRFGINGAGGGLGGRWGRKRPVKTTENLGQAEKLISKRMQDRQKFHIKMTEPIFESWHILYGESFAIGVTGT